MLGCSSVILSRTEHPPSSEKLSYSSIVSKLYRCSLIGLHLSPGCVKTSWWCWLRLPRLWLSYWPWLELHHWWLSALWVAALTWIEDYHRLFWASSLWLLSTWSSWQTYCFGHDLMPARKSSNCLSHHLSQLDVHSYWSRYGHCQLHESPDWYLKSDVPHPRSSWGMSKEWRQVQGCDSGRSCRWPLANHLSLSILLGFVLER